MPQVNELTRRQHKEKEKEIKKREKLQEKEKAERAASAKLKMEEEAYQLQVRLLFEFVTPCASVIFASVFYTVNLLTARNGELCATVVYTHVRSCCWPGPDEHFVR
jgi:hypothetical protein